MPPCGLHTCRAAFRLRQVCDATGVAAVSRMSKWRCFRTVVGCRRLSFDGTDRIVPPGKVSGVSLAVACALSRAPCPCTPIIPSPFHFHTRCGDAMLAYAAAACCVAAAYHHNMPGWTCGQCHPPSWLRNLHTTPIHRPSIAPTEYLRSRARPGAAGVPTGDTATHAHAVCPWRTAPDVV